jgi:hypothetical protein
MPRIVPSQVVDFIAGIPLPETNGVVRLANAGPAALAATVELVNQIPDELLEMDRAAYASLILAKAQISDILSTWTANQNAGHNRFGFQFTPSQNPLEMIRAALVKCPDESPSPSTSEFGFISDLELRANLRNDMGAINRALANGEWKAVTVLAGSAIEALLLWALQQRPSANIATAAANCMTAGTFTRQPKADLEWWDLHEYTEVALNLGLIKDETAKQVRLARQFRNFIHPGRTQRLSQKCDRATALSAVAGVEHAVRDLTP